MLKTLVPGVAPSPGIKTSKDIKPILMVPQKATGVVERSKMTMRVKQRGTMRLL
jgi:hypothetical protein